MTKVVDFSLYGYVHPIGNGDCFLIPIFGDDSNFWVQEINQAGVITGFTSCYLEESTKIISKLDEQHRQVGNPALYAFCFNDGRLIINSKVKLQRALEQQLNEFDNPFLKLEVLRFIGSKEENILETIDAAAKYLYSSNPQFAEEWKIRTEQQLLKIPWNSFDMYLKRVDDLISTKPNLPVLNYYFNYRMPSLMLALKELVELPAESDSILLKRVCKFIATLWHIDVRCFPTETKKEFIKLLDKVGVFLERFSNETQNNPKEIFQINNSISKAYRLISKIKEVSGILSLRARLTNLCRCLLRIDRAGFFDNKPQFLENIPVEIEITSNLIPKKPEELLQDKSFDKEKELVKLDGLINAADVYRFHALILFLYNNNLQEVLRLLSASELYFLRAMQNIAFVKKREALLFHRYARGLILKGEVFARLGQTNPAKEAFNLAVDQLKKIKSDDYQENARIAGLYANLILQTEALISRTKNLYESNNLNFDSQIEENLKSLIDKNPEHFKARQMLFEYCLEVRKDVKSALNVLDSWIESWQQIAKTNATTKQSVNWSQYLTAQICAEASTENSSYVLPTVSRYSKVLQNQPTNTRATEELIEFLRERTQEQINKASKILNKELMSINVNECPLTHAVIRILFCDEQLHQNTVESLAQALVAIVHGTDDLYNKAKNLFVQAVVENKQKNIGIKYFCIVLELLSKWYFEQGRLNPFRNEFLIANKILDMSLQVLDSSLETDQDKEKNTKDKVIWMTRKLEIALLQKDFDIAHQLVAQLIRDFPKDPIVKLKHAILFTMEGRLEEADSILREAEIVSEGTEGIVEPHPAIVDRRAYIALKRNEFDKSENLYRSILRDNQFDPTARFGLGRVLFEQGQKNWVNAFDEWLKALRLRVMQDSPRDIFFARLTARSIASLCWQKPQHVQLVDSRIRDQIFNRLRVALYSENAKVLSMLVDSLSTLSIVDAKVTEVLLDILQSTNNIILNRRIAQYLMNRTICTILFDRDDSLIAKDIADFVSKCNRAGVLPEYLAGAKWAYRRAVLRLSLQGENLNNILTVQNKYTLKAFFSVPLSNLYNHVCTSGYSEDYYLKAYELCRQVGEQTLEKWVLFVKSLVSNISCRIWKNNLNKKNSFYGIVPTISLWPLKDFISVHNGKSLVGGWVDLDILRVLENTFGRNSWRTTDFDVFRTVSHLPEEHEVNFYNRSGLFFRKEKQTEPIEQKFQCYIETLLDYDLRT